jgi:hypothetical protein
MQPPGSHPSSLQLTQWQPSFYPRDPLDQPEGSSNQSDELTITSNDPVSACEVFFKTEDLLKSTWEHDYRALQVMQSVSKTQNNLVNKNWGNSTVRLLNEEKATFSDFGIKTKDDLVRFAEKLGREQCQKITRLMLPTELISDKEKNWNDWFAFEITLHFPNISHLSFKTTFSQIPTSCDNERDPLVINWSFLEKLPLLVSIDLSSGYHNIPNIEFLKLVPQLKKLNLKDCTTITPECFKILKKLVELVEINLSHCEVQDISFIKFMPHLQKLNLQQCYVSSGLDCLSETELISLKISDLYDVEYIKDLKKLEELNLSKFSLFGPNHCKNIDKLKLLTGLKKLNLGGVKLPDLSFLSSLKNLEHLKLATSCEGTIFLPPLKELRSLDLSGSLLSNIEVGGTLPLLQYLDISGTKISNIDFVEVMENLDDLDLGGLLKLRNLEPCTKLTKLKTLNLQNCLGILNPDIFNFLTSLKDLNLSECSWVGNVNFLRNLSKLQSLNLTRCSSLRSIEGLKFLTNLKFLSLDKSFDASEFKCFLYEERD